MKKFKKGNLIITVEDCDNVEDNTIKQAVLSVLDAMDSKINDKPIADPEEEFDPGIPSTIEASKLYNELKRHQTRAGKRDLDNLIDEVIQTAKEKIRNAEKYIKKFSVEERKEILKKLDSWTRFFKDKEEYKDKAEEFAALLSTLNAKYSEVKDSMSKYKYTTGFALSIDDLKAIAGRASFDDEDSMLDLEEALNMFVADSEYDVKNHLFSYPEDYDKDTLIEIVNGYLVAADIAKKHNFDALAEQLSKNIAKLEKAWHLTSWGEKVFEYKSPTVSYEAAQARKSAAYKEIREK